MAEEMVAIRGDRPTRGNGLLEGFLGRWRRRMALARLRPDLPRDSLLDVGCGTSPRFLREAPFRRRAGVDQLTWSSPEPGLELRTLRFGEGMRLPFPDGEFDCVSMLAFIEHLPPAALPPLFAEAYRVLRGGGQMLITTPHARGDALLRVLARAGLVSREEIEEHQNRFRHRDLERLLAGAGFPRPRVEGFQLGLNILATADKPIPPG